MNNYITTAFNALSFAPGPFWLILILAPRNQLAMKCFDGFLILLSVHFSLLTIPDIPALAPIIASPTFESIRALLSTPKGILGSWNHMILSDLWIGRWIVYDSLRGGFSLFPRVVFILVTLFFGPVGLCLYVVTRYVVKRQWRLHTEGSY